MNIDEYRAMIAQEQADSQKPEGGEQPNVQAEQSPVESVEQPNPATQQTEQPPVADEPQTETGTEPSTPVLPETIEIDGQQVPIDELKNGYLRQADYTRKTQDLANQRKELAYLNSLKEQLEANPELAKQIAEEHNLQALDPAYAVQAQREQEYWDMKLELDLQTLEKQYEDFDRNQVLDTAYQRNIGLEEAYLINKSTRTVPVTQEPQTKNEPELDVESLKEQIRADILKELQAEQARNVDTSSIISTQSGQAPTSDNSPKLTADELKVAKAMGMTEEEYAKWR